jgi:endo-1,4-beta-xylanase
MRKRGTNDGRPNDSKPFRAARRYADRSGRLLKAALGLVASAVLASACSNGTSDADPSGAGTTSTSGSAGAGRGGQATAGSTSAGAGGTSGGSGGGATAGGAQTGGAGSGGSAPAGGTAGSAGNAPFGGASAGGAASGGASVAGTAGGGAAGASGGVNGGAGGGAGDSGAAGVSGGAGATGGASGSGGGGGTGGIAKSLSEKYADLFPIGAAVDSGSYTSHAALLRQHFNSITPENEMKFESLQPSEGRFTYDAADRIVAFAVQNDMKVRGHALVWHTQNPSWLFANASAQTLLSRMRAHISAVVGHFKGKVYAWDVVNEAFMDDGSYRTQNEEEGKQSQWYGILGESYIAEAFRAAHEADPDAKLYYNDFYNYIPAKRQAIYEMLRDLLDQGVPVHGVGLQGHLNIEPSTEPSNQAYHQHVENMEDAIELYASLGLDVQVTELDVSLYIPGITYTEATFYTPATFTDELETKQAERYRAFFDMFRRHADSITGVTFWGIADDNTWLSEFSSGRKDFPLLFDDSHQPKKAYEAVVAF